MEKNVRPKNTNETRAPEYTGRNRIVPDDRIFCLDATDVETAIRKIENGATFSNAGAIRGRSS
jgi:hypothetical protein